MEPLSPATPSKISSRSSYNPSTPLSSRTPFAGHYSSTSGSLHQSEDPVILEIGSRTLRAGFANEAVPRCEILYGEEMWKRVGDPNEVDKRGGTMLSHKPSTPDTKPKKKMKGGEIWQLDLRGTDVGVIEDLVERAVREAYNKYLLVDSKSKKVVLPLPPLIPIPLLTAITTTIFTHIQPSTITYFSAPVLSTVAAGLRSSLVVDIGWHETSVTPVYELRTVDGLIGIGGRIKRAGKMLRRKTGEVLENLLIEKGIEGQKIKPETLDEIVSRVVWCDSYDKKHHKEAQSTTMLIPLETTTSHKSISINVPLSTLSKSPEITFFHNTSLSEEKKIDDSDEEPDEDDLPLPTLLYNTLRDCPIDVRATCMARIVIVGRASNIPGLKTRIIDELRALIDKRGGWNRVKGKKINYRDGYPWKKNGIRDGTTPIPPTPTTASTTLPYINTNITNLESTHNTHIQPGYEGVATSPRSDPHKPQQQAEGLENQSTHSLSPSTSTSQPVSPTTGPPTSTQRRNIEKLEKEIIPAVPPGTIRGVKSLGTWAGASLLAGARVKGIIEVERERFLATVAAGGSGFPSGMVI